MSARQINSTAQTAIQATDTLTTLHKQLGIELYQPIQSSTTNTHIHSETRSYSDWQRCYRIYCYAVSQSDQQLSLLEMCCGTFLI
jgi:hypothetical protein